MEGTFPIQEKKFQSSMIFSDRMNRIWAILKERNKFMEILTKTDIFSSNSNKYNLICEELITNNYYKSISYVLGEILFKFSVYPNTLDNSSLVIFEIIYKSENISSFLENNKAPDPKLFLELLSLYLKQNPVFLYEYQSILLNCDINKLWYFLINESNDTLEFINNKINYKKICFHSLALLPKKEGDKFIYKFGTETGFYEEKIAIVNKIEQDFVKKQWSFSFNLYHTLDNNQLYCSVKFFVLIIKDSQIFLTFHHDFKEPIEQKQINILSQTKKSFLNTLKKHFESIEQYN